MNEKGFTLMNEKGFTLIEVLSATAILAVVSLFIFHSLYQSTANYISAEKYYKATLGAQNILEEVKLQLDKDVDRFKHNSIEANPKYNMGIAKPLFKSLLSESKIEDLGLDIDKYSYEVYLKKCTANDNKNINELKNELYIYLSDTSKIHDIDIKIAFEEFWDLSIYNKINANENNFITINFEDKQIESQNNYIIIIAVIDNKKDIILKELTYLYSYMNDFDE